MSNGKIIAMRAPRGEFASRAAMLVAPLLFLIILLLSTVARADAPKATIHDFRGGVEGGIPEPGLTADSDGVLYGVSSGGQWGSGIVYKVTPPAAGSTVWTRTTLYDFRGGADGGFPQAGLIFDGDGALYGATREGGASGAGTVFRLRPPLVAGGPWIKTTLYNFRGGADGARPLAGLAMDTAGVLYGVTNQGGARGAGAVFMLTPPVVGSTVWTKTTLYSFDGADDGSNPYGSVVLDTTGALYGTTAFGGHRGGGTVYKITPPAVGSTVWTKATLYSFDGVDGNFPRATVTFGTDGAIYGVTYGGGAHNAGTAYKLTPPASGATSWTKTTIHDFERAVDGANPWSELTFDTNGALYGANFNGSDSGGGTVFRLDPPADGATEWSASVVYSFAGGTDGNSPGGLVFDDKGSIYGVTVYGAANANGSVFNIALPPAEKATIEKQTPLASFGGGAEGGNPQYGTPIFDSEGSFYMTTALGGANNQGAIVKVDPPSERDRGARTVLYSFTGGEDGANPLADLVFDSDGAIYGTAVKGGKGCGVVFKLSRPEEDDDEKSASWTYRVLHAFSCGADGAYPQSGLAFDSRGRLFGVTTGGGEGYGVVFRLKPNESEGEWKQDVLYAFKGGADGSNPVSGLIFDTDGTLYGTTTKGGLGYGVVFQLQPDSRSTASNKWTQSVIHAFKGGTDGETPFGQLVSDNHGSLFGVTLAGGSGGGTAYRLTLTRGVWTKVVIYRFRGGLDGAGPNGLTFDTFGALYGTTRDGGVGNGLVFKLTPTVNLGYAKSLVYRFRGTDGSAPLSGVTFDTESHICGTTSKGGARGAGSLFKLD